MLAGTSVHLVIPGAIPSSLPEIQASGIRASVAAVAFWEDTATPTLVLVVLLMGMAVAVFALWKRERRLRNQRLRLRKTYQLGEDIFGAASAEDILARLAHTLPAILDITRVQLYVFNRNNKTLDSITTDASQPVSVSLSAPPAGTQTGAVACFHYRTLLAIPDIAKSPFPLVGGRGITPKSLLFVPMLSHNEVTGILELDHDARPRTFSSEEKALAQHLGNQIGVALRLLDQRSVQEQLFRTEKLAAVGRLISGVVNELQSPLSSILEMANRAVEREQADRDVMAIASQARKAAGIVARLVSFAAAEQVESRPIALGTMLRDLMEFREGDQKASGIRVRNLISREALTVQGSPGQLEQIFLNLVVHAEQALASAPTKVITIRTSVLGRRLLVEIMFTARGEDAKPDDTASLLGVTRSIIAGHGGEVRLIEKPGEDPRFEVELPMSARERGAGAISLRVAAGDSARRWTALVIEPDEAQHRHLLGLLSVQGYRVVPVTSADTGLDLVFRMRFDAVFCSVHAPGLNWVELSERMQPRVGGFILLSDGYDPELAADFEAGARFVLPKPVQEAELDRILRSIEGSLSAKVIPFKSGTA